jgi:hypothetical protein
MQTSTASQPAIMQLHVMMNKKKHGAEKYIRSRSVKTADHDSI